MCDMEYDQLGEILNHVDVGIHIIDRNGVTVFYNTSCALIDRMESSNVLHIPLRKIVDSGIMSKSIGLEVLEQRKEKEDCQVVNGNLVFSRGIPIFNKERQLTYVVIICMNMSTFDSIDRRLTDIKNLKEMLTNQLQSEQVEAVKHIIGNSAEIKKKIALAKRVAKADSSVLITGESGTGKGVFANYIHENSLRNNKPFVIVNCAAIPAELIESEMFGYTKGAFTGAREQGKIGLIELANTGTLFLDEIADMPYHVQGTLLRAVQEKKIRPIGSETEREIDVRLITASNQNLKELVANNKFREDLYYRINVIHLIIPPLRQRKDDIIDMILEFTKEINKEYQLNKRFSKSAYNELLKYDWPGNVRELENVVERLIVTTEDDLILAEDVMEDLEIEKMNHLEGELDYQERIRKYEIKVLNEAMKEYGTISAVSKKLKIHESTLRKKLDRFGLKYKF